FASTGIDDNASTTAVTIDGSGQVGIGTASPSAKLHISGAAGVDGIKFPDGTVQTTAAAGAAGCPAGFTSVGANGRRLGCIETAERGTGTFAVANTACFAVGARLPTFSEFLISVTNYTLTNIDGDFEWLGEGGGSTNDCVAVDDNLGMSNPIADAV